MIKIQQPDGDQFGYVVSMSLLGWVASGFTWWVGLGGFLFWYLFALAGRNLL